MPQVQFRFSTGEQVTKGMRTPKKVGDLWKGWYKGAQKVIPDVPDIQESGGTLPDKRGNLWKLYSDPEVSVEYIKFTLVNQKGERSYLVIQRQVV